MKSKFWIVSITAAMGLTSSTFAQAQSDSTGLAGDNFDLYGALDLFKQSESTEAFEKAINNKDNGINNLDLNADGKVDYVKVVDHSAGDDKVLILQDIISETESQDIAVVEMEKKGNDVVHLQIVGDEAMYGKNYIVEPKDENVKSTTATEAVPVNKARTHVYVNVWGWPGVRWMYGPSYMVWGSPYHWGYYPTWWSPWGPFGWHEYDPRVRHYHYPYYHRVYVYRMPRAHKVYYGHRTTSTMVVNRSRNTTVIHQRDGGANKVKTNPHPRQRETEVRHQKQMRKEQKNTVKKQRNEIRHEQKAQKKPVNGPRR